ncbi:hypothetical protein MP638_000824 [Amoeboaphelidium occidentale]|nr:hypothetical protein MP638_000824 [Amoeboaphelidium occidentale]
MILWRPIVGRTLNSTQRLISFQLYQNRFLQPKRFLLCSRILRSDSALKNSSSNPNSNQNNNLQKKKSLWVKVKEEVHHYWLGTKLLGKEISISTRLLWKISKGIQLSRREQIQLVRTGTDLAKLVPFSIFVIVPFMEILLPVALKLFPDMLPSTYTSADREEAKRRQLMATKLEMAKVLRDQIKENAQGSKLEKAEEFSSFFKKVRTSGEKASTEEVLAVCRKFKDDFTLNHLSRPQIVTLCRFMGLRPFGTDPFLRFILSRKLQEIMQDDKIILLEGVDSLTVPELVQACHARGIRTVDVSYDRLRFELQQWLDLHLKNEVPSTLLILARALMMTSTADVQEKKTEEVLRDALQALPQQVVQEAEIRLSEAEGKSDFKKKLELLESEERSIEEELKKTEKEQQQKPKK